MKTEKEIRNILDNRNLSIQNALKIFLKRLPFGDDGKHLIGEEDISNLSNFIELYIKRVEERNNNGTKKEKT